MGPNKPRDRTKASDPNAFSGAAVRRRSVGPGILACSFSPVIVRRPIGSRVKAIAKALLAAAFVMAGILHLMAPGPFLAITPDWVVWPRTVIRVTGLLEILGATALYVPRLRRAAGLALAAYAICAFPANIKHAMDSAADASAFPGWWYHGPRLALQPVIVWWALWCSGVIDWPFHGPRKSPD